MSLEALYKGGIEGVTAGSSSIANAHSNNNDTIASKETGFLKREAFTLWMNGRARSSIAFMVHNPFTQLRIERKHASLDIGSGIV